MSEVVASLLADGLITQAEAHAAYDGEEHGFSTNIAIGSEYEVLRSAGADTPIIGPSWNYGTDDRSFLRDIAQRAVGSYDVLVSGDGWYELATPAFNSSVALTVLTRAVFRLGLLPNGTTGMVTEHLSASVGASMDVLQSRLDMLVRLARTLELQRGTTPNRLLLPLRDEDFMQAKDNAEYAWNSRGIAGVMLQRMEQKPGWQGRNRVELRTLGSYDEKQQERLQRLFYALSLGALAPQGTKAFEIYGRYDEYVLTYFRAHMMPTEVPQELLESPTDRVALEEYIMPFVDHLRAGGADKHLVAATEQTVSQLLEEFGLNDITLPPYEIGEQQTHSKVVGCLARLFQDF